MSAAPARTGAARPTDAVHDLVGIGLGPFNLGLACLAEPLDDLDCLFLEQRPQLAWHPGMLLDGAHLQVPFLADLVTLADPTSPFSFLNYLKDTGRLYRFYIRESFYPLRAEFDAYCRWAAQQLTSIRCGQHVQRVEWAGDHYLVHSVDVTTGDRRTDAGRRLVLGVGTPPHLPEAVRAVAGDDAVVHTSDYLGARDALTSRSAITVLGSGQSAAEVYRDLLPGARDRGYRLDWVTRSPRFFPLEYTKLTLEMTSPEYTDYFHALPAPVRDELLPAQAQLYKGIDGALVDEIYDLLYALDLDGAPPTRLLTGTACESVVREGDGYRLGLHHLEQDERFSLTTGALVLATGYRAQVPALLDGVRDRLRWDAAGRFDVTRDYRVDAAADTGSWAAATSSGAEAPGDAPALDPAPAGAVFVQNAEGHTHGLVAPDLGMAAYRNSCILRALTGREVHPVERSIAFQRFGAQPSDGVLAGGPASTAPASTAPTPSSAAAPAPPVPTAAGRRS